MRKFKSLNNLKIHLFLLRIRDYINFSLCEERLSHKSYGIISRIENGERYYSITRMIWTKKMVEAINKDYSLHIPCCRENKIIKLRYK